MPRPKNVILQLERADVCWIMAALKDKERAAHTRARKTLHITDAQLARLARHTAEQDATRAQEIHTKLDRQLYPEKFSAG